MGRKEEMRLEMGAAQYCLAPEGDTAETSRIYDAVMQLCVPVVLSLRVPVPTSAYWRAAAIVIEPSRFLAMGEAALRKELAARPVGCSDLMALRRDLGAAAILDRLGVQVKALMESAIVGAAYQGQLVG